MLNWRQFRRPRLCISVHRLTAPVLVKFTLTEAIKGQLQRFDKLSLFDRFRHVENGFDIIS